MPSIYQIPGFANVVPVLGAADRTRSYGVSGPLHAVTSFALRIKGIYATTTTCLLESSALVSAEEILP